MEILKIIVTGDTHLPAGKKKLPEKLLEACRNADLILHTGDWKTLDVYRELSQYAAVKGVYGNADGEDITQVFPIREIFEVVGMRIGMVHGHGEKKTTERRVLEIFEDDQADIIIFGHSHIPYVRYHGKTLLINPGSPTAKRKLPYFSFITLDITECVQAEIVFFND
ncbi:metallophosphoesterase family protein [Virgibacillus halophilus]|uniref:Phosphoesterase n=1 Tax=Tigheibacillus halophilus TaxID=361280 RepID=A0ABU5C912_9BACI|nr:metallophosphoesterase [Virgibacillus halophilus]